MPCNVIAHLLLSRQNQSIQTKSRLMMKSTHLFNLLLLLFSMSFMIACGSEAPKSDTATGETSTEAEKTSPTSSAFSASPEYPDAELGLASYADTLFTFDVKNYELAAQTSDAPQKMCANSGKGQHIHLIVDDLPYAAKYESSFTHPVEDGTHYLLAFLSRSYHESIKTDDAHIAIKGTFANNAMTESADIEEAMLFYSRPKGTYVGKANTDKIMLDFYLVNTTLAADGNKVKVEVNGTEMMTIDEWKPTFIEGLPMGDNKVRLTLIDKDGKTVDTPLNPVERVFTLKADPVE